VSFNMIAGEKDRQTLCLLLSQPVSFGRLVTGKVLARGSFVFGCMCGFSLLFLTATGAIRSPARVVLWMLAVLVYGLFWFALAIGANGLGRSAASTALVLAVAWLAFLFLIPSSIHATATTLYPVPPRISYINQVRTEENEARRRRTELVTQFLEAHPEVAAYGWNLDNLGVGFPKVPEAMPMHIEGIEIQKRLEPVIEHYEAQLRRQKEFANRTRYLSPAVLMQGVLYDLAGTGRERYQHFLDQLNRFSEEWHRLFVAKLFHREMVNASDYDRLPGFTYHEEELSSIAGRVCIPLVVLFSAGLVLTAVGLLAYKRYPVVA
jgi:ABC-2 type transport system permease protein